MKKNEHSLIFQVVDASLRLPLHICLLITIRIAAALHIRPDPDSKEASVRLGLKANLATYMGRMDNRDEARL